MDKAHAARVRQRWIDSEWEGENKRIGLTLIDKVYFGKEMYDQESGFMDTYPIPSSDLQFDELFFNLIKKCTFQ